ncbi:NUDIX domain-containing protein [Actinoallomurus rhizosphaericola]|uniref:NUDIX domain-containing protein n=1 Tax=Actinoallomurus rhizosphaericola TaxID=2952536 RepID=UPI0020914888|nr:NUDIX hydrolase [Actinoallomurus rhizosphaericola]MCO5992285.1 NUDIX hydrolase [Actinoallomurus rhizosphaericola]
MIQVSSRVVYQNRWMTVREDDIRHPDGSPGIYGVVDKPTAALIIPMEDDGFHLVEQYRYTLSCRSLEFPQGTWPDDRETSTEELARAELVQETGLRAETLKRIGSFAIGPGFTSQRCDVFLATGLTAGEAADRDPEEQEMTQRWVARRDLERMIREGEIVDGCTMAAYTLLTLDGTGER